DMDQLSQNTAETIKLSEKLVEEKPKHLSSLLGKTFAFLGNKANALIRALGATLPASSIREQRIKSTINHIQSPTIGSNASLAIRNKLALNTHISRWLSRGLDEKQRKLGRAEQDLLRVFQRSIA
ncbi:MAG: hypothetical protein OXU45_08060, partial [Candidatus Melainabacteria bacterium]|nr:hypothetical protein [Candidatus Melainabacteria bacterium]